MGEKEQGAPDLGQRIRGEEERCPQQADGHADQRDHVGRDRRSHQPPREGERDAPFHVPRHEAFVGLDESAEEPRLGGGHLGAGADGEALVRARGAFESGERPPQLGHQLVGGRPLSRDLEHVGGSVGLHHTAPEGSR